MRYGSGRVMWRDCILTAGADELVFVDSILTKCAIHIDIDIC